MKGVTEAVSVCERGGDRLLMLLSILSYLLDPSCPLVVIIRRCTINAFQLV